MESCWHPPKAMFKVTIRPQVRFTSLLQWATDRYLFVPLTPDHGRFLVFSFLTQRAARSQENFDYLSAFYGHARSYVWIEARHLAGANVAVVVGPMSFSYTHTAPRWFTMNVFDSRIAVFRRERDQREAAVHLSPSRRSHLALHADRVRTLRCAPEFGNSSQW